MTPDEVEKNRMFRNIVDYISKNPKQAVIVDEPQTTMSGSAGAPTSKDITGSSPAEKGVSITRPAQSQTTQPLVPCPYGDKQPVNLSYYLDHMADFALRGQNPEHAKLYQDAAKWVREKAL